jgi:hypothetical protein
VHDHPLFSLIVQLSPGCRLNQGFDTRDEASEMARDLAEFCEGQGLNREITLGADGFTVLVRSTARAEP